MRLFRSQIFHHYGIPTGRMLDALTLSAYGTKAWEAGDLDRYGQLVFESGWSSIHNYECGCEELIRLYDILHETDGVYGARFSGAGFKGCCMALIDPEKAEKIVRTVTEAYLKAFPALTGKYEAHVCESADGVKLD